MTSPLTQSLHDLKRRAILTAARAAFTGHGFAATSVDAIARTAGVGKGTIYDAFSSKEELLLACCLESCAEDQAGIQAAGGARWSGFPAALATAQAGGDPDLDGLVDPLAFARGLLLDGLQALLRRPGIEGRMFLDLVAATSDDPRAQGEVRSVIDRMLGVWERMIAALLTAARNQGRIRPGIDPAGQARLLLIAFDGLLLQHAWGRFADPEAEAVRLVDAFFQPLEVPAP
ncbi:MAG: hypothetical protein RLZZ127_2710 [Planctomycetota bacterium]|jgi:AcrR family transcriptional regulator